jgi:hypothetical protein
LWLAARLVPPAASTSGSEAGRLTSRTGVKLGFGGAEHGSPTGPMSPEAATTVTRRLAAVCSAAFSRLTSVLVKQCSPSAELMEITSPCAAPNRTRSIKAVM